MKISVYSLLDNEMVSSVELRYMIEQGSVFTQSGGYITFSNSDESMYKIIEWTGVYDKNGNEIAIGDTVNAGGYWDGSKVERTTLGKLCTVKSNSFCDDWSELDWKSFEIIKNSYK